MIALKAEDVKSFTTKLFVREDFDAFLVKEVNITTYNSFSIDGHVKQGYYTEEEREENNIEEFSTWKTLRPFCFSLIKGKKLPGSFRIVLQLSLIHISEPTRPEPITDQRKKASWKFSHRAAAAKGGDR